MRHSDIALTLDVYTDKPMLPLAAAIEKLPVFLKQLQYAHPCAHNPDFSDHAQSRGGKASSESSTPQLVQDEERSRTLALSDVTEQQSEKSCLARIRTQREFAYEDLRVLPTTPARFCGHLYPVDMNAGDLMTFRFDMG